MTHRDLHEHDGHPDFKCVLTAYTLRDRDPELWLVGIDDSKEEHALIYTDGNVAVTLFECCYAMWELRNGRCVSGSFSRWTRDEWMLATKSMHDAKRFAQRGG